MTNQDLIALSWPAMRYALGRKTYVTHDVSQALISVAHYIPEDLRYKMGEEIAHAINAGQAGMAMDIVAWENVCQAFSNVKDIDVKLPIQVSKRKCPLCSSDFNMPFINNNRCYIECSKKGCGYDQSFPLTKKKDSTDVDSCEV